MQRIALVIEGQLVGLTIQSEPAMPDAVGIAANGHPKIIGPSQIARQIIITEQHVGLLAVPIRPRQRLQSRAIGKNAGRNAVVVRERDRFDRRAVWKLSCGGAAGFTRPC